MLSAKAYTKCCRKVKRLLREFRSCALAAHTQLNRLLGVTEFVYWGMTRNFAFHADFHLDLSPLLSPMV